MPVKLRSIPMMHGTVMNGQIVLDGPPALPDGTRVTVLPIGRPQTSLGMREDDWPNTPGEIAAHLARMDQIEAGWLSPDDEENWRRELRAAKEAEKSQFHAEADRLKKVWE